MSDVKEGNLICIGCPKGCRLSVKSVRGEALEISGYECRLGRDYAGKEFKNPVRVLTTTVRIDGAAITILPVKTSCPIKRNIIFKAMRELADIRVQAPISCGDPVLKDILGTGADVIATRSLGRVPASE